jgi:hypothetical protein
LSLEPRHGAFPFRLKPLYHKHPEKVKIYHMRGGFKSRRLKGFHGPSHDAEAA